MEVGIQVWIAHLKVNIVNTYCNYLSLNFIFKESTTKVSSAKESFSNFTESRQSTIFDNYQQNDIGNSPLSLLYILLSSIVFLIGIITALIALVLFVLFWNRKL